MIIDYKNSKFMTEKNKILNLTMPCETCVSTDCSHSKVVILEWIEYSSDGSELLFKIDKKCENIHFKNFPSLHIKDKDIKNCVFENCHEISTENSRISGCVFKNVGNIFGHYTDFQDSVFKECCSYGPLLVIDSGGRVNNCTFETITTLGDDGYVVSSNFDKKEEVTKITNCKFIDCQVESEDGELCRCSYFKAFSSFNTVPVDNVDYDTCEVIL